MSGEARRRRARPSSRSWWRMGENGAIGSGGDLPWRLSSDLTLFPEGHHGQARHHGPAHLSVASARSRRAPQHRALPRLPALSRPAPLWPTASRRGSRMRARARRNGAGVDEIMVIGGEDVFRAVLPLAGASTSPRCMPRPHADTWFPRLRPQANGARSRARAHAAGPKDEYAFSFVLLERAPMLSLRGALRGTGHLAYNPHRTLSQDCHFDAASRVFPTLTRLGGPRATLQRHQDRISSCLGAIRAEAAVGRAAAAALGARDPAARINSLIWKKFCAAARTAFARPCRAGALGGPFAVLLAVAC